MPEECQSFGVRVGATTRNRTEITISSSRVESAAPQMSGGRLRQIRSLAPLPSSQVPQRTRTQVCLTKASIVHSFEPFRRH